VRLIERRKLDRYRRGPPALAIDGWCLGQRAASSNLFRPGFVSMVGGERLQLAINRLRRRRIHGAKLIDQVGELRSLRCRLRGTS
jgi:hypothetical protein